MIDIVDAASMLLEWIQSWLGCDEAELVGIFGSVETGTAKLAFRYRNRGYMLTLEDTGEEDEND